jgi:WD40 repeat protein
MGGVWCVAMSGDGQVVASGGFDGSLRLWNGTTGRSLRALVGDRRYERMNITGLTGITDAQRGVMRALGAIEKVYT